MAMREAVQKANPVLLEPIVEVRVVVAERFMGDVMSLFNGKRGRVAGMNPLGDGRAEVSAQVPQADVSAQSVGTSSMKRNASGYFSSSAIRSAAIASGDLITM